MRIRRKSAPLFGGRLNEATLDNPAAILTGATTQEEDEWANTKLSMRKIKDVLRLTHDGHLNTLQVALSLNISRSTVKNYQERAQKAGLSWPFLGDHRKPAISDHFKTDQR